MNLTKVNEEWVPLQIKVFTRWVNNELKDHNLHVEDITKDLSNGVALVELAKELTQKSLTREWCSEPKRNIDMVQNCDLAIEMFERDGVRLVGISGKDINDNNTKLILGLIWSLILHYSIDQSINDQTNNNSESTNSTKNQKDALMSWAIERTSNYPNIKNFSPYDLSICALLDSYYPEKINYYSLNPTETEHNSQLATKVMNELGIPVYVYPEDIQNQQNQVDDKTLLTQLSKAKVILDKKQVKITDIQKVQEKNVNIENPTQSSSDAQSEIERLRKELAEANAQIRKERELREKAESNLQEVTDKLHELENASDDKAKIEELIKENEEIDNENSRLERKLAQVTHKLHQVEKQSREDNSLLEKMSIELTEQEYDKVEEGDVIDESKEKDGNNILQTIVNIPKAIAKSVIQNLDEIEKKIIIDNDNNNNNDNENIHQSNDTYTLSILGCENSRYVV